MTIPLSRASLCANCHTVSNAVGETCPACAAVGCLMNLARVLDREQPSEREITRALLNLERLG